MKKVLLVAALAAGTLTLAGGSTVHAAGPGPYTVTGSSENGRQLTDSTAFGVAGGSTGEFAGQTCTVSGTASNQASVHLDNNLIINSGSSSVTLFNVEREPGVVTVGGGPLVLGDSVSIDRFVGNDDWSEMSGNFNPPIGLFSASVLIEFDCAPPPPEPDFSVTGECTDDGAFVVTVTNTGDVELTVDVEGGNSLTVAPGASDSTEASDTGGDGNITASSGDIVKQIPDQDCEEPSLAFGLLAPVCVGDIPYIGYNIDVSGLDVEATTATIRLFDVDRNPIPGGELTDQPLSGQILWPGASADPADWPGWVLNEDGFWVPDPSDAVYRDGIIVQAEVNPTSEALVQYPPATTACNSPENPPPPPPPPTEPPPSLPVTGGETTLIALFGVLFASLGGLLLNVSRRRTA